MMDLNILKGKTLPLNKDDFNNMDWINLSATIGYALIELNNVAMSLKSQDESWFRNNKEGLPNYYLDLSAKLLKIQQSLFGYNVMGEDIDTTL